MLSFLVNLVFVFFFNEDFKHLKLVPLTIANQKGKIVQDLAGRSSSSGTNVLANSCPADGLIKGGQRLGGLSRDE